MSMNETTTELDDAIADLFDLDLRTELAADLDGMGASEECTTNGCTETCLSCGCR